MSSDASSETLAAVPSSLAGRIKAVAFDLDGLMFNTEEVFQRAGTELLARRGKPAPPELFAAMMGRRAREAQQVMIDRMQLTDTVDELQAETSDLFDALLDDVLAPMPGLMPLLDLLEERSIPKAVCTSSGTRYAHDLLRRYDLVDRFAFVLAAEDVTHGKPHPEVYATAAVRLGAAAEHVLVLEDSAHGIASGNAAGAVTAAVPHAHSCGQNYDPADLILKTLADPRVPSLLTSSRLSSSSPAR